MAHLNIIRTRMRPVCLLLSSSVSAIHLCRNRCWSRHFRNVLTVQSYKRDHKLLQEPFLSYSLLSNIPQLDLIEKDKNKKPEEDATEILKNLSPEDAKKLKIIKLEFEVCEQMNEMVPQVMTDVNWLHALEMTNKWQRKSYYRFLRIKENYKRKDKEKQQLKQQKQEEENKKEEEGNKFRKNSIFFRIRESTIHKGGNYRLANAMMYGTPLVFDMDYEQFMRHQDCNNVVDQLMVAFGKNRDSMDPYHLFFTSLSPKGKVFPIMQKRLLQGEHFLATLTERNYLDLFPHEKLVYLSPHAPVPLKEVSGDDIYIVGGFVDKAYHKPVSFARAKAQGIRSAKLPLDNYLMWGCGTKNLTLDQMMGILLEQGRTKDWNEALREIPIKKLRREDDRV